MSKMTRLSINEPELDGSRFFDDKWIDTGVPRQLSSALADIEKSACGIEAISDILGADQCNRESVLDNAGIAYTPLNSRIGGGLRIAQEILLMKIHVALEGIEKHFEKEKAATANRGS